MAVAYDGSAYRGWQAQQPGVASVQSSVEKALSEIAGQDLRVHCAGRTDAAVHATQQVIHFEAPVRPDRAWIKGGNTLLPRGISALWVKPVSPDFHARFSATARRYRYCILNTPQRPAHGLELVTWESVALNDRLMDDAAQSLLGEQDFSSFRAASCQSNTPMRCVHHARVRRSGDMVVLDIQANAFLHHMVRNIAGSLIEVGKGRQDSGWIADLMRLRDRRLAAATAKPFGLYLVGVNYDAHWQLPQSEPGPWWLADDLRSTSS